MKKLLFLPFLVLCFSLFAQATFSLNSSFIRVDDPKDIPIKGTLPPTEIKSARIQPAITALQYTDAVAITFINLGALTVKVIDSQNNTVYQTIVNTATTSTLTFSTAGWPSGVYTIYISDSNNNMSSGIFEL